jgi:DNA polymerase-1
MNTVYETLERPLPCRCWRAWSGAAFPSTGRCCRACPAISRRPRRGSKDEIQELAGEPFNPGSPKQLGDILFGKMGLPGGTKTKTGAWSTSAQVLEELAEAGPRIAEENSRMAAGREAEIDLYRRAAGPTSTRRRSASTPPMRSPRPRPGACLVERAEPAEHSGAHRGRPQDSQGLHREPGTSWFRPITRRSSCACSPRSPTFRAQAGLPRRARHSRDDGVGNVRRADEGHAGEVRRRAKAINFGIIYGISAFGLANQLGIPREEAGAYIKKYFERFPGIRDYMDATKEFCARARLCDDAVRPQVSLPRHQGEEPSCAPSTSAPRSTRGCRAPPPTSSAAR